MARPGDAVVSADHLSDREIELIIAYLKHMAGRKQAQ